MIQIINGIKIKAKTIDEAINLIFNKKKKFREIFLINSLTMNMIDRLLLINEVIIRKALENLDIIKEEQKTTNNTNTIISKSFQNIPQLKEEVEINLNLSIMSNVYTKYIRRINNDIKSAEERCDIVLFPKRVNSEFILGTVLTSDIGFKVMKDLFKEEIKEYRYIEATENIQANKEKRERQQNWIKTLINEDNEFNVEGVTINLLSYKQNITHSKITRDDENQIINNSIIKVNDFLTKNQNAKKVLLDKFFITYKMQQYKQVYSNLTEEEKKQLLIKIQSKIVNNTFKPEEKIIIKTIESIIDIFYINKLKDEVLNKSLLSYFEEVFIKYKLQQV